METYSDTDSSYIDSSEISIKKFLNDISNVNVAFSQCYIDLYDFDKETEGFLTRWSEINRRISDQVQVLQRYLPIFPEDITILANGILTALKQYQIFYDHSEETRKANLFILLNVCLKMDNIYAELIENPY